MSFIRSLILAVSLLLAVAVGALFVTGVLRLFPFLAEWGMAEGAGQEPPGRDMTSLDVLSRLSLFPGGPAGRTIVAVVVENHAAARPHQRGLADALLVQEYLVEGLISRFVAFFDAAGLPRSVGPVRSIRSYFLDGLRPLASVIYHAGGSPDALDRARDDPHITALNGLALPEHFLRADGIPAPHDLFISRGAIKDLLPERLPETLWPPYALSDAVPPSGERAGDVRVLFFNPDHDVTYAYDSWFKWYERTNGGLVSEARPRNVLILETLVREAYEQGRLRVDLTGSGRLLLFRSGAVFRGFWAKASPDAPFVFSDARGGVLPLAPGQTWMTVLPTLERVKWEMDGAGS